MGPWQKNWPELRAALTGGMPDFVWHALPDAQLRGIPVFCFHQVHPTTFQRDLQFLQRNGYHTLRADQLLDHLNAQHTNKRRAVVLTFDDGAANLYRVVYPLLRKYRMNAVAFIAPRFHDETTALATKKYRTVTWDQLREMDASGIIDCQSHTHCHRYVPRWPQPAPLEGVDPVYVKTCQQGTCLQLREDLLLAKNTLESKLDKSVCHLAFPQFDGNDRAILTGLDLGYRGFWWGALPRRPLNNVGSPATRIVRLKGDLLRRLPGRDRLTLHAILRRRLHPRPLPAIPPLQPQPITTNRPIAADK